MTEAASAELHPDGAKASTFVPGQPDMWAFVLFEALVFTSYFTTYVICRTRSPQLFLASQAQLDIRIGVFNTVVLLVSSWSVARCVQAARSGSFRAALNQVVVAIVSGLVFAVSKLSEWVMEIGKGFTFTTDEFSSFYYFLTAIHFLHVLIGFIALAIIVRQISSPRRRSQQVIETCATYWHTVDFLWIMIFALLYVMR